MNQSVTGGLGADQETTISPYYFGGGILPETAPAHPAAPPASPQGEPEEVDQAEPEPATPAATDAAAERLREAEQARAANDNPAFQHEYDAAVSDARSALYRAVLAEAEARLENANGRATVENLRADILGRHADHPTVQGVVDAALDDYAVELEVERIATSVAEASDPEAALARLADAWETASPEARARLLQDSRVMEVLDTAAEQANAPLGELENGVVYVDEERGQFSVISRDEEGHVRSPLLEALENLEELTSDLPPELAAEIVARALPAHEQVLEDRRELEESGYINLDSGLGNGERELLDAALPHLANIADHVAGAENGEELVERLVGGPYEYLTLNPSVNAGYEVLEAIVGSGTGPALLLELARQGRVLFGGAAPLSVAMNGIEGYVDGEIRTELERLFELTEQLNFALQMRPLFADDEEFEAALDELMTEVLGPNWQTQIEQAQVALAEHGDALLTQMEQLQTQSLTSADQEAVDAFIEGILEDPIAQAAISLALQHQPGIAAGERGEALLDMFSSLSLGEGGRALALEFGNIYVNQQMVDAIVGLDANDPASHARLTEQLETLRDDRLAAVLDVSPEDLGRAIDALQEVLPSLGSGQEIEPLLSALNAELNDISGFDADSAAGQIFRGLAFAAAGAGEIGATELTLESAELQSTLEQFAEALEFLKGGLYSSRSIAAIASASGSRGPWILQKAGAPLGSTTVGKLFLAAGVLINGWNVANAVTSGDLGGAGLHAASLGGLLLSTAGGPWTVAGFAVVAVAQFTLGAIARAEENNRFQTPEMRTFLEASGLSDEAAGVLYDTSGEAYSPIPLLLEYGRMRGLTTEETIEWINLIDPDDLAALRDYLHNSVDTLDGDLTGFGETAESDESFISSVERSRHPEIPGPRTPASAVQVDAVLQVLGIPQP